MRYEGFVAQVRANTIQPESEVVHATLQYAASFHCLNRKIVKNSSRSQKKNGSSLITKGSKRSIIRSGVLLPVGFDA